MVAVRQTGEAHSSVTQSKNPVSAVGAVTIRPAIIASHAPCAAGFSIHPADEIAASAVAKLYMPMVASDDRADQRVRTVARLAEPLRHRLYDFVVSRDAPTSREQAAAAAGISRSLAAYHLDTLVEDGLLVTSYARTSGRTGPGAGRTAKLYRRSSAEVVVSVPARDYELAASLLADAVEHDPTGAVRSALNERAHRAGTEATHQPPVSGAPSAVPARSTVHQALATRGYEPNDDADGTIRMRNCPFHRLVADHRDLICEMNLSLVTGILESLGDHDHRAILDPRPGYCCVAVIPSAASSRP